MLRPVQLAMHWNDHMDQQIQWMFFILWNLLILAVKTMMVRKPRLAMVLKVAGSEDKDLRQVISENGQAKRMAHFIQLAQFLKIKIMHFRPGQVRKQNPTDGNLGIIADRTQVIY